MTKRFSIGIDLGTSNSALAVASADAADAAVLEVQQICAPNALGAQALLPSALYIPFEGEFQPEAVRLPWDQESAAPLAGVFARDRGALTPDRLVVSAKSWLCSTHVDRRSALLPWRSPITSGKISPLEASRLILQHLRQSLEYSGHSAAAPALPQTLDECEIIITVPASFDETARALTVEAAHAAGFAAPSLVEEPLAAFYSWITSTKEWRDQIAPGEIVLVCDVGGGTADFTLIAAAEQNGELDLHRIAVGDHILLGGDNMDLALAYLLKSRLESEGRAIDQWQFLSLVHAARSAKERLLGESPVAEVPVSIAGRGSSLFASTISTALTRADAEQVLVEGYFPRTSPNEFPATRRASGFQEFGLPYAADPALTKHLARFLQRALENVRSDPSLAATLNGRPDIASGSSLSPDVILFNGGVFNSPLLRQRVIDVLGSWRDGKAPRELSGAHLDLAAARGAAAYGLLRLKGEKLRVRAGATRSYYLGMETSMPAVPGIRPAVKGVCVVPQGMEEGSELELAGQEFGLITGEPVEFRFFSSTVRAGDRIGTLVDDAETSLEEHASVSVCLPALEGRSGEMLPVILHSRATAVGTLELWMKHLPTGRQWKLEFNIRGE